jgi:hypothetical protein
VWRNKSCMFPCAIQCTSPSLHHRVLSLIARKRNLSTQTGMFRDDEKVSKCICSHRTMIKVETTWQSPMQKVLSLF